MSARPPSLNRVETTPVGSFSRAHASMLHELEALNELPALVGAAQRARLVANAMLALFDDVVLAHHADEEEALFPAVLGSAEEGGERARVELLVKQLTQEHRAIESAWNALKPDVKIIATGGSACLDASAVTAVVDACRKHADWEEREFLPLAQQVLARNSIQLAALGTSLQMRHATVSPRHG